MKIIIELPTWLGDALMATPAIENLNNNFIDPKITLIGSQVSIEALKNHPNITKTYILEANYFNLYKKIKSLDNFDFFFSFRGSLRSKLIKSCISSKRKYQFNKFQYSNGHQVEKYNNFINDSLNIKTTPKKLLLHHRANNQKSIRKLLGINPGASYGSSKRWHPDKFAEVARELSRSYDIIIYGVLADEVIANDIEKYLKENGVKNYKNLVGKTTIEELINEISNLDLLITGDSGPMHMAAALQIPTISIFGPTKDKETSQWLNLKSIVVKKNLECQPCMKRVCPLKHHDCMKQIKVTDILEAVDKLN
jgi:heptosyltransferase II